MFRVHTERICYGLVAIEIKSDKCYILLELIRQVFIHVMLCVTDKNNYYCTNRSSYKE